MDHNELNQSELSIAELEEYLSQELCRIPPPQGFADRLIAAAAAAEAQPPARANVVTMKPRTRLWIPTAIAAALLTGGYLTEQTHARHQREQAALAQQQFESALRITGETLDETRQQLRDAGLDLEK